MSSVISGLSVSSVAFAQTATTTPGAPTTALGGDLLTNIVILAFAVVLIGLGIAMYKSGKFA